MDDALDSGQVVDSRERDRRSTLVAIGVYAFLTLLVWGLFALDRGPWQDEALVLYSVQKRAGSVLDQLFHGVPTSTRTLGGTAFAIAQWTGSPVLFLQLVYGSALFATGWVVHLLVRDVLPGRPWLAYLAGAIALTSSGDFTLNYLGATTLSLSVCAYFLALLFLIRYAREGGGSRLAASGALLVVSLTLYEAALPAILLSPLLVAALQGFRPDRRTLAAAAIWYGVTAIFLGFLLAEARREGSYLTIAMQPMSLLDRWDRTETLFWNNFTPWSWGLGRRNWFPAPPPLPTWVKVLPAMLGVAGFWWAAVRLWRRRPEPPVFSREEKYRAAVLGAAALILALASNAVYASVHLSQFFFRTQLVSCRWASIAVALISYGVGVGLSRNFLGALIVPALFVGFGVHGGLERQEYFLGHWRRHRVELRSIVEQVPPLLPVSHVLLYVPPGSPYRATEASYLARSWVSYLYGDPSLFPRVFLWSPRRGSTCVAEEEAFRCRGEASDAPREISIPYRSMVLLTFRPGESRFVLERAIPRRLLGRGRAPPLDYAPGRLFTDGEIPGYARRLLYRPEYLARLLPLDEGKEKAPGETR